MTSAQSQGRSLLAPLPQGRRCRPDRGTFLAVMSSRKTLATVIMWWERAMARM